MMVGVWNWIKLLLVRVPLAIVILLLTILGQVVVRIGRSLSTVSHAIAAGADRYVPVCFDWSDRYWQRQEDRLRGKKLAQLNERNGVSR